MYISIYNLYLHSICHGTSYEDKQLNIITVYFKELSSEVMLMGYCTKFNFFKI